MTETEKALQELFEAANPETNLSDIVLNRALLRAKNALELRGKGNKSETVWARLTVAERDVLDALIKTEGFTISDALRYTIRFTGRAYGLLPTADCPDCGSQETSKTANDLRVCEERGQEFEG